MNVGSGRNRGTATLRIKSLAERRASRPKRVYIMPSDAESKYKEATKFQETKCKIHQVKITSFCDNCANFVCNVCKHPANGHDCHDFMSATEKTTELKGLVRERIMVITENVLSPIQKSITECNAIQYKLENNCDGVIRAVDERERELIREVEKYSRRLKAEIEKHRIKYSPSLASKLAKLEDRKKSIEDDINSCDNVIHSGNSYDLLARINSTPLSFDFNSAPISLRVPPKYEFCSHRPSFYVEEMFGYIRQSRVVVSHDSIKVTNSRKYDIYLENVFAGKDCIWINKTGCFVSLKPKTGQEMDMKICSVCPSSFVVTTSGDIIYTVPQESSIYITQTMTVKLKHTYPYSPCGLCLAISGGFYVTLHKERSDGKIVRYFNEDCNDWLELACYRGRKPLLKMPTKIAENGNRDVWVIDAVSSTVFAISSAGKFKFEFKGRSEEKFEPMGICTDCRNNVLISDFCNKVIDILAYDGQLVTTINLERLGISRPMGLCITKDGELCVGQGNGWMHFLRYLQ